MTTLRSRGRTLHSPAQIALIISAVTSWSAPFKDLKELHDELVTIMRTLKEAKIIDDYYLHLSTQPAGYQVHFRNDDTNGYAMMFVS